MPDKRNVLAEELYTQHLKVIAGVKFTRRQIDVIACIVSGWDVKSIAAHLSIAPSTIETHIDMIVQKLGSGGRNSIIRFVEKSGKDKEIRQYYQLLKTGNEFPENDLSISPPNQLSALDSNQKVIKAYRFKLIAIGVVVLGFMCIGFFYFKGEDQFLEQKKQSFSARSDLPIPHENQLLKRSKILQDMDQRLNGAGIQSLALVGIGGVGKTTLARQYGHLQQFPIVWEINAETKESLAVSFEKLAYVLAKTEEEKRILKGLQEIGNFSERNNKILWFVKERLRVFPNWLLIYDNVEEFSHIQESFPQDPDVWGRGKIIITTRNNNVQGNSHISSGIQIGNLSNEEKLFLFAKIMWSKDHKKMTEPQKRHTEEFLQNIPSFPLDVSLAAYYVKTTNISYKKYLDHLGENNKNFTSIQQTIMEESTEYKNTRDSIVTSSIKKLISTHQDYAELLLFIMLCDSQNIPRELLDMYKGDIIVDRFLYDLKKYSLVTVRTPVAKNSFITLSIHRSTQEISLPYLVKTLDLNKQDQRLEGMTKTLEQYTRKIIIKENIDKINLMVNHTSRFLQHDLILNDVNKGAIACLLGNLYLCLGYWKRAEHTLQNCLVFLEKAYGQDHIKLAWPCTLLGFSYLCLGNFIESKEILEKGLFIYHRHSTKNYAQYMRAVVYLGNVYSQLGESKRAKNLLEQSQIISKQNFSQNPVEVAKSLGYLANIYRNLGEFEKAKDLFEQSRSIYQKYPLQSHTSLAWILGHLGDVYRSLGDYKKAQDLLRQSLAINKKLLAPDHRDEWALRRLGYLYRDFGNYGKAKNILEKCLRICQQRYNEAGHYAARGLSDLGDIHRELGNYDDAQTMLKQGLLRSKKVYPPEHSGIARIRLRLGRLYLALGTYQKAKSLLNKSLISYKNFYGQEHTKTAGIISALGELYLQEGHLEDAERFFLQALSILDKTKHMKNYRTLENLSDLYLLKSRQETNNGHIQQANRFKKQALSCLEQSLKILGAHFPKNSPHITRLKNKASSIAG